MDLNEIKVFVQVVQSGSFKSAALQLGMPNSTVSSKVSSLEKNLGVSLLRRTTRKLNVTPAGLNFYQEALAAIEQLRMAADRATEKQQEASGLLRITAPVELGISVLPGITQSFLKKFPHITLEFVLSDRRIELISEGIDLAIRAGELQDSSLIAKKMGLASFALFASPFYFKNTQKPQHPRELSEHDCLSFKTLGMRQWKLSNGKSTLSVPIKEKMTSNDLSLIKALCIAGNGIALLPTFLCQDDLKRKKLIPLLSDWRANSSPVHFVYPAQKFMQPKLRAFIDHATLPLMQCLREVR